MIETKPIARRTMLASSLALLGVMGAARPVAADATEGFAPVSGSRLFYRVEGAGEPLLLLAGFNCDHAIWDALTPMLSHRFRVIRFDNRGIGRSVGNDDAADLAGLTTRLMAEDTAALLRALDIRRAHVLGHSLGGQIAQELSLRFPYLVATLSLLSCWAKPDAKLAWLIRLFGDLATTLDDDRYPRALLPWMFTDDAFNAAPKAMEDAALQWAANPLRPSPALLFAQSRAILATDTAAQLGGIDTPTSVIVATGDALTPPHLSRALVAQIKDATYTEIAAGGHAFILDAVPLIADHVSTFLASHPLGS
jgi:pimeloyl-ACP methyl ester carboxylesterase